MDELPDLISQRHPLKVRQGAVELILGVPLNIKSNYLFT